MIQQLLKWEYISSEKFSNFTWYTLSTGGTGFRFQFFTENSLEDQNLESVLLIMFLLLQYLIFTDGGDM